MLAPRYRAERWTRPYNIINITIIIMMDHPDQEGKTKFDNPFFWGRFSKTARISTRNITKQNKIWDFSQYPAHFVGEIYDVLIKQYRILEIAWHFIYKEAKVKFHMKLLLKEKMPYNNKRNAKKERNIGNFPSIVSKMTNSNQILIAAPILGLIAHLLFR